MTLVERLRDEAVVMDTAEFKLLHEAADRIEILEEVLHNTVALLNGETNRVERLEKALQEIATQCEHMAAADLFDPDWVIARIKSLHLGSADTESTS